MKKKSKPSDAENSYYDTMPRKILLEHVKAYAVSLHRTARAAIQYQRENISLNQTVSRIQHILMLHEREKGAFECRRKS